MIQPVNLTKHLGFTIVAYARVYNLNTTRVVLMSPSDTDEGRYAPAESVEVSGIEGVTALRDFCNEVIKQHDIINPKPPEAK